MRRPFDGAVNITQEYGVRDPIYRKGYHTGVDYGVPTGTPVLAPEAGRVESGDGRATSDGRGFFVIVFGDSGTSHHLYHLQKIVVASGRVTEGQQVGVSDNTGLSAGPHLHWETRRAPYDGNSDFPPANWLFSSVPNPPAPTHRTVYLPPVPAWRLYNEGGPYMVGYEKAVLSPVKFGGLEYPILGTPVKDVVIIQTVNFGRGAIYVGPGTNAVIK